MAKELELSKNNIKILHVKNKEAKKIPAKSIAHSNYRQ